MAEIVNNFVRGIMNKDLDERIVPDGYFRNALNIDIDTSDSSQVGTARNSLGNTRILNLTDVLVGVAKSANDRTIGAVKYESSNLIYWLVAGDEYDGIFEYNEINGVTTRVLQCDKATPTTASKLNFNRGYLVTGINYLDGFLYWTDDFNPPRKINIARAKGYGVDDDRIDDDINVILAPPLMSPTLRLFNSTVEETNNILEKFLYFSYRWKYIDNQYSAMSPFSAVAFAPGEYEIDYAAGNNKSMTNTYDSANITFRTGGVNVKEIQLLMHDTRSGNVSVIESFNKQKLSLPDFSNHTFTFNNNKTYRILTQDQLTRTFDNVPLLAKAQDIIGNRLAYGNYTQFYDMTDCNGDEVKIDLSLKYLSESTAVGTPIQTWRSDRDYEVAIEYLDDYGRHTTAFTSENNTIYIPPTQSDTGNSILVNVNHRPPCWATGYRLLIKSSKKSYYNIFPILYYAYGTYRYFLINESDRDKFAIGDYVIFKSTASGPTYSNKKYKILELKDQTSAFIPAQTSVAGLYFKVKADDTSELNSNDIFTYSSTGIGGGRVFQLGPDKLPVDPLYNQGFDVAELPIFYGNGNGGALSVVGNQILYGADLRITIEISSSTTYNVYLFNHGSFASTPTLVSSNNAISVGSPILISASPYGSLFNVQFSTTNGLVIGDKWVINMRGAATPFGNSSRSVAIIPGDAGDDWGGPDPEVDRAIETGAIITLQVAEDTYNPFNNPAIQTFPPSPRRYENIEEWWVESGARDLFNYYSPYSGANLKGTLVRFRRGKNWALEAGSNTDFNSNRIETGGIINAETLKYPMRMLVMSNMPANNTDNDQFYTGALNDNQNKIVVNFTIRQQDTPTICETVGKENNLDVYHETVKTFKIKDEFHKVVWSYQDFTAPGYALGNTNLGQLVPGAALTADDEEHSFVVGDRVYVNDDVVVPNGFYNVVYVPNPYNIVIDFSYPGAGAVTPGTVAYNDDDQDQTDYVTTPAVIKLNNTDIQNSDFNAWAFGNGLESDRIKDDFNETEIKLSPRVNAAVEDYSQRVSYNAICYSGIYGQNTAVNALNEFNLSIANFKYLDSEFGSIQKLNARDTDLLVFQENKISQVLYGKNLLFDAVGGGQVTSIPEVLGTQVPYPGEWGISKNPESFAEWGGDVYFTDARRGVVLQMTGDNQIVPISYYGMMDHFRDVMSSQPNQQKLGGYDPFNNRYVLSYNETSILKCKLILSKYAQTLPSNASLTSTVWFTIVSDSAWTIAKVSTGSGTTWASIYPTTSGFGTTDVYGSVLENASGANRSMNIVVTYCNGQTQTFVLTQSRGKKGKVVVVVKHNKRF